MKISEETVNRILKIEAKWLGHQNIKEVISDYGSDKLNLKDFESILIDNALAKLRFYVLLERLEAFVVNLNSETNDDFDEDKL